MAKRGAHFTIMVVGELSLLGLAPSLAGLIHALLSRRVGIG